MENLQGPAQEAAPDAGTPLENPDS